MEIYHKDGTFPRYCEAARKSIDANRFNEFAQLASNEERFRFVNGLRSIIDELQLKREFNGKCMEQAIVFKTLGNKAFQAERWNESLVFYNKCYLSTPKANVQEKSIILANRSAALYHLEKYDLALRDIQRALNHQYPKQMMYKLTERKARCFLAKKDYEAALDSFKATVTALDESTLPLERRQKLERDAQIMINLLPKNIEMEQKMKKKPSSKPKAPASQPTKVPEHFVDKALWFDYTQDEGRFARTKSDLKPNTILLLERPHVAALLEDYSLDHCTHCFRRVSVPIACPLCSDVIFCSDECEAKANGSYHRYECGFLPILWGSGASITCHMALRMITQKSGDYFAKIKPELAALTNEQIDQLPIDDYRKVYKLVTHESERTPEDLFQRTLMATMLNTCLTLGGYSGLNSETQNYIGGLLLHNLQLLQYNAHEVSEMIRDREEDDGQSTFIGGGLYPTLALFNHSCDPGVTRYYRGNQVCVRTVKNIPADSMVAENYGPLFTQVRREERHQTLLKQYRFTCQCEPCLQNWPLFSEMDPNVIRFRCDGGKICSNVLNIPAEINDFMVKCTECGEHTNIMKGLKMLQDTDMLFKSATRLHAAGEYETALLKYMEMMATMNEVLVPPYRDYHLCQQGLRACMLEFGNRYTRAIAKK
ncbi:SET and MYND domain-containing protein 4 [Anopheles ziemanni]|uniref:SET and MYND domain-containing protein 4 n=1 Tax=Anopheles coustani TaxID=139045 RepID=UPI0026586C8F|nr:SET and MYND domain-containing protein 4 [Anopheles coustani]XP_058166820.1 SET and MYND domain-containing protein 4 [Anopheles ziemanni]